MVRKGGRVVGCWVTEGVGARVKGAARGKCLGCFGGLVGLMFGAVVFAAACAHWRVCARCCLLGALLHMIMLDIDRCLLLAADCWPAC